MQLGITIPMQKYLKMKAPDYGPECDLFFCWELHKIQLQNRSTLAAVNASNRLAVILNGMRPADWKAFPDRFLEGMKQVLRDEGYNEEQIERYLDLAGDIEITKTHGRKAVSGLNRMDEYLWFLPIPADRTSLYQSTLTQEVNRELCHAAGFPDYGQPVEFWKADMERVGIL